MDPPKRKKEEEILRERERERERQRERERLKQRDERGGTKPKEGDTHTSLLIH